MLQITYPARPCQDSFQKPKADRIIALSLDAITSGTAGAYPVLFDFQNIMDFRGPMQSKTVEKRVEIALAPSTAQLLLNIRDIFTLRMSELAQIFGVSRRAAYDWLEGAEPKPDTVARIYVLNKYAEELKAAGIAQIEHFVRRPVVSGRSLLDLLKSGESIEAAIDVIKRAASEEAKNRRQLGQRISETNTTSVDGFDEVSTPVSE